MSLLDILQQYAGGTPPSGTDVHAHFDEAARQASPQDLAPGIAAAFRSDQTPPFGQMVGQLFDRSNPQQQAGLLNQLIQAIGPAALSSVAGGALGRALGAGSGGASATPAVTPAQAQQVPADAVAAAAAHAEQQDGSIVDKLSGFYAQHPDLVKGLGATALAIALGRMRR
ncbi:MAG TPA: hypothetical protein VMU47_19795 [Caldimonas sp.]|nr:hypothetical protein [Caldimonas sp.]